jgi:glyoxalase family protein
MPFPILGLHHVTATVSEAQRDLDFAADALGLRLVKKTVNFDNHHVFHFYYGDERGTPGTLWTTFPYAGKGVRVGSKGTGQVTTTSFSVPANTLEFWKGRFTDRGFHVQEREAYFGERGLVVTDPSGLNIELVGSTDARVGWQRQGLPANAAVRGLHSVTLTVRSPTETLKFMRDTLGFQTTNETRGRVRVGVNGEGPGRTVDVAYDEHAPVAVNGLGTVHHVAFAIEKAEDQLKLRDDLLRRGVNVTPVMDRQYFQSIYFREPGGVLFEVATVPPGFLVDEPLDALGSSLKLPAWEEPNRQEIERGLPAIAQP